MSIERIVNWITVILIPVVLFLVTPYWSSVFADKKGLEYFVTRKTRLNDTTFGVSVTNWPDVRATYAGKEIDDATFLRILIRNSGKVPIKAEDYEGPIVIVTDPPGAIISHRLVEAYPPSMRPDMQVFDNGIFMKPMLMNPGDAVHIEIFGSKDFSIKSFDSRIVGVTSVSEYKEASSSGLSLNWVEDKGYGRTLQRTLFKFPPYFYIESAITSTIVAIILLYVSGTTKIIIGKIVIWYLCLDELSEVVLSALLFPMTFLDEESPIWARYIASAVLILASSLIGLQIKKYVFPLWNKPPNKPPQI